MDTEDQNTKTSPKPKTKGIGIALLVLGALCTLASFDAPEDIGLSLCAAGVASILAGIGFIKNSSKSKTKGIGIALLVLGALCIPAAFGAPEDIDLSLGAAGIASILAGIGFIKNSSKSNTKGIGIALLVLGVLCIPAAGVAFEDIGLSFGATGIASILAGIGFSTKKFNLNRKITLALGIALLVLGALCILAKFISFGAISLSFGATGIASILAGIGLIKNKNTEDQNTNTTSKSNTKVFGIALLVFGVLCIPGALCILASGGGDFGLSFGATGIASILAGIGLIKNKNTEDQNTNTTSKSNTEGIGIALLVLGVLCILDSLVAFRYISTCDFIDSFVAGVYTTLSFGATGIASILAGIGFIKNK